MLELHYYPGTAAICLYLCDRYPAAGLAPAIGSAQRAQFYKWLIWLTNTLQAALMGGSYSALDPYAMMLCRWTRGFSSAPARDRSHPGPYLQRVLARPAVQQVFATEQLAQPWV